jgi:hypothetical protein
LERCQLTYMRKVEEAASASKQTYVRILEYGIVAGVESFQLYG